ncbi:MAG: SpoIIE family protein phosphatase, partial [Planctomycetota bacterium]
MAELAITTTDGQTRTHPLSGPVLFGRDASCAVLLDDPGVSRRHAQIRPEGDGFVVEDLGSKNGTLLNGVRCTVVRLSDGDEILLGTVHMVFRAERPASDLDAPVVLSDRALPEAATHFSGHSARLLLPQRRLEMLYELSERLTRLRDRNELLEDALDLCFETLQFERGAIAVHKSVGRGLDWPVVRNLRAAGGELTISRSVLSRALEHGERAVITDSDRAEADPTVSMVQHGIRSALCVPLQHQDEILGVIYGDRISTGAVYSSEDLDFLAGLAKQVSIGVINSRLMEEQEAKLRLEHEISLARDIQQQLFPASLPQREGLQVAVLNEPGRHVSGDYYDVIELTDGRIAFVIADVTGEGVAAALLMANLQAAVRVTLSNEGDPGLLLGLWNRLVYHNTEASKFVTCLVGIVDPQSRELRLANAGHPQPFGLQAGGGGWAEVKTDPGLPLGIQESVCYQTQRMQFATGACTLYCSADGVVGAMNDDEALFTRERLVEVLQSAEELDPAGLIK